MKAVWLIVVFLALWATWCNLEQGHRITDLEVRNRDLVAQVRELSPPLAVKICTLYQRADGGFRTAGDCSWLKRPR